MRHTAAYCVCLVAGFLLITPTPGEPPTKQDRAAVVARLIADLDNDQFKVREEATSQLIALDEEALPALRKAREAKPSLEVFNRLNNIIAHIERSISSRNMQKALARVNEGGIDQFIDLMVLRPGFATDQHWQAILQAAEVLVEKASELADKRFKLPRDDYLKRPVIRHLYEVRSGNGRVLLKGLKYGHGGISNSLVLSSGPFVQGVGFIDNCILFANGGIGRGTTINNSVIFCNGDIDWVTSVSHSVIIATGKIKGSTSANDTFYQARYGVEGHTECNDNIYLNQKEIRAAQSRHCLFIETTQGPLEMLKMFNLTNQGLKVARTKSDVVILEAVDGKPFAKAGIYKGDRIISVDGDKVSTEEDLCRSLRYWLPGDAFRIKFYRGDKEMAAVVRY